MRQESVLKSRLVDAIKKTMPGCVLIRHEDVRTSGIPDFSLTGYMRTSWWEVKHGTPKFDSTGIQELTMLRLAGAGFARYIIYDENKVGQNKRTLIVHPKHLKDLEPEVWCVGHDHRFIVEYITSVHTNERAPLLGVRHAPIRTE